MTDSPVINASAAPLLWLLLPMVLVALLKAFLPRLRGILGERAVSRVLKRYSNYVVNDVILPDGRGGLTQIDHIVLTPRGILVIETKNYSGLLFGQAHEQTWTQVIGHRRQQFQNPLRQNHGHIKAVEALVSDLRIEGRVVFVGRARFPKGRPPGVVDLAVLEHELASLPRVELPPPMLRAWTALIERGRRDRRTRGEHLAGVRARRASRDPSGWMNAESGTGTRRFVRALSRVGLAVIPVLILLAFLNQAFTTPKRAPRPTSSSVPSSPVASGTRQTVVPRTMAPAPASPAPVASSTRQTVVPRTMAPAPASPAIERRELKPKATEPQSESGIQWTDRSPETDAIRRCREAQVSVLIENSASNRQRRDRLCGDPPTAADREATDTTGAVERWRPVHSAGELTPNF